MIFDPNQTSFTNDYQRAVWQHGIQIVPPEVSLADVDDEEIREGCMQIYNCILEIYKDMYNHTEEYGNRPDWYVGFYLLWIVNGITPQKCFCETYTHYLQRIPLFGFSFDENINAWTNDRYPLFNEYFPRFAELYKKRKQNMGNYLQHCDFRLFTKRFNITFNDLLRPLANEKRAYFSELREYAMSKGMKEEKAGTNLFYYTYNKKRAIQLRIIPTTVTVPYGLSHGNENSFERFLDIAEKQSDADALVKYILDNLNFCDGCAANVASRAKEKEKKKCGYYMVNIRDKKRLSCAGSCITTSQYSRPHVINDEDIRMMKRMVDIRIAQIDSN